MWSFNLLSNTPFSNRTLFFGLSSHTSTPARDRLSSKFSAHCVRSLQRCSLDHFQSLTFDFAGNALQHAIPDLRIQLIKIGGEFRAFPFSMHFLELAERTIYTGSGFLTALCYVPVSIVMMTTKAGCTEFALAHCACQSPTTIKTGKCSLAVSVRTA